MVKRSDEQLNQAFAAPADPTRRAIGDRSARDDGVSVNDLYKPFKRRMTLPAVSKHLRVLERAGLLRQERDGRVRRCHLEPEPLKRANAWVERYRVFWSGQLDALADFLEREED